MTERLLIVDDHAAFRAHARELLTAEGVDVVGEAGDTRTAMAAVAGLRPDVVLLDVCLPDVDGIRCAEFLARGWRPPSVILTSSRDAADFGARLRAAPVRGFVPKSELCAARIAGLLVEPAA